MRGEFYKMDFRAWNLGTVDLTLEQEAAYLRLCHAMYDVGGPVPNSTRFLQSIFRCGNTKAAMLLKLLIDAGKIAVTNDGRLFNHRVSEELAERERVSAVRRVAGERGGSAPRATAERLPSDPRPDAERQSSEGEASGDKSLKNNNRREAIASTSGSREEERREEEKTQTEPTVLSVSDARRRSFPDDAWEQFYARFPHKVGKLAAQKKFDTVRKSGRVAFAELMEGLERYIATKPANREWCNPATFLNQGRWADEPAQPPDPSGGSHSFRQKPCSGQQFLTDLANGNLFGGSDDTRSEAQYGQLVLIAGSRH